MFKLCYFFLMFVIYSFIGYLIEVTCVSFNQKKIVFSRGYLIGPYLPIFGVGAMVVTFFLSKYKGDVFTLAVMTMVCCCILEYYTSLILEKIFKLRWWDYSDKKFNLNGRICLETGVMFGLGGVFIVRVLNPLMKSFLGLFSKKVIIILGIILFFVMLIDFGVSTFAIIRLKIDTSKFINQDATRAIKEEVSRSLRRYRYLHSRLLNAFPEMSRENETIDKIRETLDKLKKPRKK